MSEICEVSAPADIFDATMGGLEGGLHVAHIATFDLKTCEATDEADLVLRNPSLEGFDQIPVRRKGQVVGVLHRFPMPLRGQAEERMVALGDSFLVSADAPLMSYIRIAASAPYRLVVDGTGITGIVTRSDMLKLPVRVLAFALVTHLEMMMVQVIRSRCGSDDETWLQRLSEGRRKKTLEKLEVFKKKKMNPPLLELTEFCDKRDVVAERVAPGRDFLHELEGIEELRNSVAHAATYANNDDEVRVFVERMLSAERWIDVLRDRACSEATV